MAFAWRQLIRLAGFVQVASCRAQIDRMDAANASRLSSAPLIDSEAALAKRLCGFVFSLKLFLARFVQETDRSVS
jgi:hypothetical protein